MSKAGLKNRYRLTGAEEEVLQERTMSSCLPDEIANKSCWTFAEL